MKLNLARGFSVPASLVLGKNKQGGNDEEAFVRSSNRTLTLFEKCLGQSFVVAEMETVEGLPYRLAKLYVGHILGKETSDDVIWVEPEYLQPENGSFEGRGLSTKFVPMSISPVAAFIRTWTGYD